MPEPTRIPIDFGWSGGRVTLRVRGREQIDFALSTRFTNFATVAFFAATLIFALLFFLVVRPIFTQSNTFEDGLGYLDSAQRFIDTGSPYQDWQLAGPYGAVTASDTFRYPPPFAQVAALFALTGTGWLLVLILVASCFLAPLVLARSRRQAALALWLGLAFLPDWPSAWEGQVTGLLTIAVAFALCEFPVAIWAGAALKVTPIMAVPAALLRTPRAVVASAVVLLPFLAASVIISPVAWTQFPAVLVNGFLGGVDHPSLAPAGAARYLALAVAGASMLASLAIARRHWPLALYLAVVAGLLGPGFFPTYYLPVLVPFLFVGILDRRARPWSVLAFLGLSVPFSTFSLTVFVGMGLLGMSMWRLKSAADGRSPRAVGST